MKLPTPDPENPRRIEPDLGAWGFDCGDEAALGDAAQSEEWLERLRSALRPRVLGRIGDYEVLGEAQRGGQGMVFRALQPGTRRVIALKRLIDGALASRTARARFEREIESAASLQHPGIVTVFGMDVVEGQPLLAMEWIEGEPITSWCSRAGTRRAPEQILELFGRVADAVQHAHQRGVLHRDLKPSNVLVDARAQPHVLDFGLAKRLNAAGQPSSLGEASGVLGTPSFASPEQLRLLEAPVDARSDVYSLGVLLYEMLTGLSPWGTCETVSELLVRIDRGDPARPSTLEPRLARAVDGVVLQAMAREPELRYASVEALGMDVRRVLAGERVQALPPGGWALVKRAAARNKLAATLAACLFLALGAFALHARWQNGELQAALSEARAQKQQAQLDAQRAQALLLFLPDCMAQSADPRWAYLPFKSSTSEGTLQLAPMSTPAPAGGFVGPEDVAGLVGGE